MERHFEPPFPAHISWNKLVDQFLKLLVIVNNSNNMPGAMVNSHSKSGFDIQGFWSVSGHPYIRMSRPFECLRSSQGLIFERKQNSSGWTEFSFLWHHPSSARQS
jgi:hypothetical protein